MWKTLRHIIGTLGGLVTLWFAFLGDLDRTRISWENFLDLVTELRETAPKPSGHHPEFGAIEQILETEQAERASPRANPGQSRPSKTDDHSDTCAVVPGLCN